MRTYLLHERFVADFFHQAREAHRALHLLFVTCHMVKGYEAGDVKTGDLRLRATIIAGNAVGAARGVITAEDYEQSVRCGQKDARHELDMVTTDRGEHTMIIAYAGKDSFAEGLADALDLRKETKRSSLVLVTCNCDLDEKLRSLGDEPLVNALYVTPTCGGMSAMRDILESALHHKQVAFN